MPHPFTSTRRSTSAVAYVALLMLGASACGGGDESSVLAQAPAETAAPAPTSTVPATTVAPTTTVLLEATDELVTFGEENRALIDDWSVQIEAFGAEAIGYLDDVSLAPTSPEVRSLSDQLAIAIGEDTIDPTLVTVRDFASGLARAITLSMDGDQDAALTLMVEMQAGADQINASLELITA